MRKLRPTQRLLLILAFLGDLFEDLADAGGLMSFSCQQVYGFVPPKYKRHNFLTLVSRSLKIGNLEKEVRGEEIYLRLTSLGEGKVLDYLPIFKYRKKRWDGKWLVVVFDIEEKHSRTRKALREKLRELGFGMLQRSVWISPYDFSSYLQEFLENIGLGGRVLLIGPTKILIKDQKRMAFKVFGLKKLNQEYQRLVEKWEERKEGEEEKLARQIKSRYLEILAADPLLPEELLPKDWWGKKAERVVRELIKREKR